MLGSPAVQARRAVLIALVAAVFAVFAVVAVVAMTASRPAGAAEADVGVGDGSGGNVYVPSSITIAVGDTVNFNWASGFHSVTAADGSFDSGAHGTPGAPFSMTFNTPGEIYYYCTVHATAADATDEGIAAGKMVGEVIVQAQSGGTATATATATPTATQTAAPTGTATATRTATPMTTATAAATPSAPRTGQAGLVEGSTGAGTVAMWVGLAVVLVAGARVLSQRPR